MLSLQQIGYRHPDGTALFEHINLSLGAFEKIALIGNNGSGKSTLLRIAAGVLAPSAGIVTVAGSSWFVPQVVGQFNNYSLADALGVAAKLAALREIMDGNINEANIDILDEDWTIEARCREAMDYWQLPAFPLDYPFAALSGGEQTRVFLAGILVHEPDIVLMDEPSNHLDRAGRERLYHVIETHREVQVVVSHDRELLNRLNRVYELGKKGLTAYGGNYDFYAGQKLVDKMAFDEEIKAAETAWKKARAVSRETIERQQKLDARGKKKQEKAGLPTISMNTLRNNAEKSTSRIKEVHAGKVEDLAGTVRELRKQLPALDKMRFDFDDSMLHNGKLLVKAKGVNHDYGNGSLWPVPVDVELRTGERVSLEGPNGAGKTTFISMLLGTLSPTEGRLERAEATTVYIDQQYALLYDDLTVAEQAQRFNINGLLPHEVNSRLTRFLFNARDWMKPCRALSGGERMRLVLCCLSIRHRAPDIIVLDEPTNNLDLQNAEVLAAALNDYKGTLVVVSHDAVFLEEIGIQKRIRLLPAAVR